MFVDQKANGEVQTKEEWRGHLLKAADLIRTHGHTKGSSFSILGNEMCAMGAIFAAVMNVLGSHDAIIAQNTQPDKTGEYIKSVKHFGEFLGEGCPIVSWNDAPERTAEE